MTARLSNDFLGWVVRLRIGRRPIRQRGLCEKARAGDIDLGKFGKMVCPRNHGSKCQLGPVADIRGVSGNVPGYTIKKERYKCKPGDLGVTCQGSATFCKTG